MNKCVVFLVVYISCCALNICTGQVSKSASDECKSQNTCGECIRFKNCFWNINTNEGSHCRTIGKEAENADSINPKTYGTITDKTNTDHLDMKTIELKIRPGDYYNFTFNYKHLTQYPVDIYFLMDMSKSMQSYRSKIASLAKDLFQAMRKRSNEVYMGFGSFVDKTALPFVNVDASGQIINPCKEDCTLPYSFKNHLKLTTDVDEFSNRVINTPISANIDGPEGSLEALLQAIVCTKEIGWREKARHLIILSTDDMFHVAGDGRLAGIVEPNDGKCHLENDVYTHGLLHDYPSVGQVNENAAKFDMNVLFVITPSQQVLYGKLIQAIKNSYIGPLEAESDNIVNLVEEFYENITSSTEIAHNFDAKDFNIKVSSKSCSNFKNNICYNILNNEKYDFTVNIEFKNCPNDKNYNKTYFIKPDPLSEQINIKVEMLCDCPCEHNDNDHFIENAANCSKSGDSQCGVCICIPGKIGNQCQCNIGDVSSQSQQNVDCLNVDCSGNGECNCGICSCNEPFSGKNCECNDDLCMNKDSKEVCSNNGKCHCGKCTCNGDWTGPHCDCSKNTDTCKQLNSDEICSNNGECNCGKCTCTDKEKYGGQFCEECKTCPKTCNDFEECVRCHYDPKPCDERCLKYVINETLEIGNPNEENDFCKYQDAECLIYFSFNYFQDASAEIFTQKVCTITRAGMYSMLSFIILGILLLGLILLAIWKFYTEWQYKKEYAKFVNESTNAKWSSEENPLFKKPVSEFQNPMYKKAN